jgi:hypothetical protein
VVDSLCGSSVCALGLKSREVVDRRRAVASESISLANIHQLT